MKKRELVFLSLLAITAIGSIIDRFVEAYIPLLMLTNTIVQMVLLVTFIVWWEVEDAKRLNVPYRSSAQIWTILLTPVGLLIHCLQSRRPLPAMAVFFSFILAYLAAVILGAFVGEVLVAGSFEAAFPPEA